MDDDDFDTVDELPAPPRVDIPPADRDLLELAARAIGAQFEEIDGEGYGRLHFADGTVINAWNPLVHSDDAFNLMVRLRLDVCTSDGVVCVGNARSVRWLAEAHIEDDPSSDARRAVTRAAAEIGKTVE